jgi:hypothetical protein
MKKLLLLVAAVATAACAEEVPLPLPITSQTVVAKVVSFETVPAAGGRFQSNFIDAPYGWDAMIVAEIVAPSQLAGREFALPFGLFDGRSLALKEPGTIFRWESEQNLAALRRDTESLARATLPFPRRGIIAYRARADTVEFYPSVLNRGPVARR